ncbi:hypothetical protein ACT7DD_28135 [Bacillus paranthracis]
MMQRVDTDADKIDALYFLKSVKNHFTQENLNAYAQFLIDNIQVEINEFFKRIVF